MDDPDEMVRVLDDVVYNSLDQLAPVGEFRIPSNHRHDFQQFQWPGMI